MNLNLIEKIADAVLYEGYILYPYRPSAVKNRQRFNFGVLTPQAYSIAQRGAENWMTQTECLVLGDISTVLDVKVRFLHLLTREVGEWVANDDNDRFHPSAFGSRVRMVESLEVGGRVFHTWQEAIEREVNTPGFSPGENGAQTHRLEFTYPSKHEIEPLSDPRGERAGVIVRTQRAISGAIELRIADCGLRSKENPKSGVRNPKLFKVTVRVLNQTPFENAEQKNRDEALMYALASAHSVLSLRHGEFISLFDPPEEFKEAATGCDNIGTWPVLVGEDGARDAMLSSPIILYDYPRIAPESAGDLCDGTEIDEILTLRILALTDEEKREMRDTDERARQILERTEVLPAEQLMKLHGVLRSVRSLEEQER